MKNTEIDKVTPRAYRSGYGNQVDFLFCLIDAIVKYRDNGLLIVGILENTVVHKTIVLVVGNDNVVEEPNIE